MMKKIFFILFILPTLCFLNENSNAQIANGVAESAGKSASALGYQAKANREIANRLYEAAIANEAAAWKTWPPNVDLFSQALQQSKDGNWADIQAREAAQAAMKAIESGDPSAHLDVNALYGGIERNQIHELATTDSPLYPQVKQKLDSYNINLSGDRRSISTPVGDYDIASSTPEDILDGFGKYAVILNVFGFSLDGVILDVLGVSLDGVKGGAEAGTAFKDKVVSDVMGKYEDKINALTNQDPSGSDNFGDGLGNEDLDGNLANKSASKSKDSEAKDEKGLLVTKNLADELNLNPLDTKMKIYLARRLASMAKNKARIAARSAEIEKLKNRSALGASHQNIFKMVQARYDAKEVAKSFYDQL